MKSDIVAWLRVAGRRRRGMCLQEKAFCIRMTQAADRIEELEAEVSDLQREIRRRD